MLFRSSAAYGGLKRKSPPPFPPGSGHGNDGKPYGFTTFPQPPPTPLFPSDFLPIRERNLRDFLLCLKAKGGIYYQYIYFPIFRQPKFRPYFCLSMASPHGIYYQYIYFPIFDCYYSLSRRAFQVPWTGFFTSGIKSSGTSPNGLVCTIATSQYLDRKFRFNRCCRAITTFPL